MLGSHNHRAGLTVRNTTFRLCGVSVEYQLHREHRKNCLRSAQLRFASGRIVLFKVRNVSESGLMGEASVHVDSDSTVSICFSGDDWSDFRITWQGHGRFGGYFISVPEGLGNKMEYTPKKYTPSATQNLAVRRVM